MPDSIQALVDQMPAPTERGILNKIDRDAVYKALDELTSGGADAVRGLVELLVEPGRGDDGKARYAIHALAVQASGLSDDARKRFAESLAAALAGDRAKAVKEFVVRELQVCAGAEVATALGNLLADEELCEPAAQALAAIGGGAAAAELRRAVGESQGKQRLTIVQNLGVLRDKDSLDAVKSATTDDNADIRTVAVWALANIGEPGGVAACLAASEKATSYERIQAAKSCLLLAERLRGGGHKSEAQQVLDHVRKTRTDESEQYLRNIADRELSNV
jgi:HEAT repeat protein